MCLYEDEDSTESSLRLELRDMTHRRWKWERR